MATNIGVIATGDRDAVERIAAKRGVTVEAVIRKERARMRRLFGRGALYRADILGAGAPARTSRNKIGR